MTKKLPPEKEYLDEYEEWQRHKFDPGHFTGGRIPVWIKYPTKALGIFFLIVGLGYAGWVIYDVVQLLQKVQTPEQIVSIILLSFASLIFLWGGVTIMKKTRK